MSKLFSNIRIGNEPDFFLVYISRFKKENSLCILKQDFLSKILEKYCIAYMPFKLQLYFLQFPKRKAFLNYLFFPLSILFKNHFNFNRLSRKGNKPQSIERSIKKVFEEVIYFNKPKASVIDFLHEQSLSHLPTLNIRQPEPDDNTIISHYNKLIFNYLLTSANSLFYSDKNSNIETSVGLTPKVFSHTIISKKIFEGGRNHHTEGDKNNTQSSNIASSLEDTIIPLINVKNSYFSGLTINNTTASNIITQEQNLNSLSDRNQPGTQKNFSAMKNEITVGNTSYFYFPSFMFNKFSPIDLLSQKTTKENEESIKTPKPTKDFLSITNKKYFSFNDIDYFQLPKFISHSSSTIGIISNKVYQENIQNTKAIFNPKKEYKKAIENRSFPEQSKRYPQGSLQKSPFKSSSRNVIRNNYFHKESKILNGFPSIKYFNPNLREYPENPEDKNIKKTNFKSPSLNNSYFPTDKIPSPVYSTGDDLFHLADKVYKIIVERVRREKEMGGY
jgi:hypothetical protein